MFWAVHGCAIMSSRNCARFGLWIYLLRHIDRLRFGMSARRRPTIPFREWRLAIDLEATGHVQNQPGTPAYECACVQCKSWAAEWRDILPSGLVDSLCRLGIDPGSPTDLYGDALLRISYHVVGRILAGPEPWQSDERLGPILNYQVVREDPWLSVLVMRQADSTAAAPECPSSEDSDLIVVDMRLSEPHANCGSSKI